MCVVKGRRKNNFEKVSTTKSTPETSSCECECECECHLSRSQGGSR